MMDVVCVCACVCVRVHACVCVLQESWSALLCASKEGHLEIVIELLEHQAQLEHTDMVSLCASLIL